MVRQCFDIQDTYGKTANQLDNLLRAMIEDLSHFDIGIIEKSFVQWRQVSEKIPTVKGMLDIIHAKTPKKPTYNQFEPSKGYYELTQDGKNMFDRAMAEAKTLIESGVVLETPEGAVPWFGVRYDKLSNDQRIALREHFINLIRDKGIKCAEGYAKYLTDFQKYPRNLIGLLQCVSE